MNRRSFAFALPFVAGALLAREADDAKKLYARAIYDDNFLAYMKSRGGAEYAIRGAMERASDAYRASFPIDMRLAAIERRNTAHTRMEKPATAVSYKEFYCRLLDELDTIRGRCDMLVAFFSNAAEVDPALRGKGRRVRGRADSRQRPVCYVNFFDDRYPLEDIAIHEMGHTLGARHPGRKTPGYRNSYMRGSTKAKKTRFDSKTRREIIEHVFGRRARS